MTGSGPDAVFVYGTLLPGQKYFHLIAPMVADHQAGRTRGRLFHLPAGYPAMVEAETGWVRGELLRFNESVEKVLEVCDRIEGYQPGNEAASLFIRVVKQVEPDEGVSVEAWCYCIGPAQREALLRRGQEVSGGDWLAFRRKQGG
jgi:gamma-glutamylcyclotransferase (GGCT)/AIG2-like uncharacterized protein YtfP